MNMPEKLMKTIHTPTIEKTLEKETLSFHPPDLWGWILIHKPVGLSSFLLTQTVRNKLNIAKSGHAGTLDPLAQGLLPIALGPATRLIPYLMDHPKSYIFEIHWGHFSLTDDSQGPFDTEPTCSIPDRQSIDQAIKSITGVFPCTLWQNPPIFCARKYQGQRAYNLALKGQSPALDPKKITIYNWTILHHIKDRTYCHVQCSSGTYVRSLTRDLALKLGLRA